VISVTSNVHARKDWGILAAMQQASPSTRVFSGGLLEKNATQTSDPAQPLYDITLFAEPVERADPCAEFALGGNA